LQIWVYNSNFLLHLVVIVVVIRCRLSSRDVTVDLRRPRALSCVVIIYRLCAQCHALRCRLTSTSHFVVHSCTSSSSYVVVVHCGRPVTKETIVFWIKVHSRCARMAR